MAATTEMRCWSRISQWVTPMPQQQMRLVFRNALPDAE